MKAILQDAKQITCILPQGTGSFIEEGLINDFGIRNANFYHARGVSRFSSMDGLGAQQEKDVLEVAVESDRAEEVFDYIFSPREIGHASSWRYLYGSVIDTNGDAVTRNGRLS